MVAKFIVLALAVASASAVCVPACFQQQESTPCFSEVLQAQPVATVQKIVAAPVVVAQSAPTFVQSSDIVSEGSLDSVLSGSSSVVLASGPVSNGPSVSSQNLPVLQAPPVTLNAVEGPVIRLPSPPIPGPRVIRHKCYCTKTVVRPQVIQRTITVPRIQRYLKQSYRPVVENVAYQARPVGSDSQGEDIIIGGQGSSSSSSVPVLVSGGVSSGSVVLSSGSFSDSADSFDCQSPCEQLVQTVPRCF